MARAAAHPGGLILRVSPRSAERRLHSRQSVQPEHVVQAKLSYCFVFVFFNDIHISLCLIHCILFTVVSLGLDASDFHQEMEFEVDEAAFYAGRCPWC